MQITKYNLRANLTTKKTEYSVAVIGYPRIQRISLLPMQIAKAVTTRRCNAPILCQKLCDFTRTAEKGTTSTDKQGSSEI
jgi:hypothetical protein